MVDLKLYHFNPNDYDYEWFVVADSKESAIKALNAHLLEKPFSKPLQWGDPYFERKVHSSGAVIRRGYTIDVYEPGQVFESERS